MDNLWKGIIIGAGIAALLAFIDPARACDPSKEWCYPCAAGQVRVCEGEGWNRRCYCVQR